MALLEQTSLDLHFMTVENRIFIRRSQTERVTVVLEDCFFFFFKHQPHFFHAESHHGSSGSSKAFFSLLGVREEEGEAIVGTGPMSGAVEECRHVQQ